MKTADICRTILHILADAEGHPLQEDVLREHLDSRLRPKVEVEDWDAAMKLLKAQGYVRDKAGDFGEQQWLITEKGETWRLK